MTERRVLLVDDSPTVCTVVERLLRKCGFEDIEIAHGGQDALDRLKNEAFEIILCDWEMAPVDGVQVLAELRRDPEARNTRFILMSAKRETKWVLAAKRAGADGMITKPFDAAMLKIKTDQVCRRL